MAEGGRPSFILGSKSVELQEEIGKGAYSRVFAAVYKNQLGQMCKAAAKKVRTSSMQQNEIQTMQQLNHKNIIKFYGVFIGDQDETYIVMELAERKDLRCFLNAYRHDRVGKPAPVRLPPQLVRKWVLEGASALEYLHSLHQSHRDIKSLNYLVMSDFTLKLGDLGLSKELFHTAKTKGGGTCQWMAPEVISQQLRSPKSDVFSFGIVVWEIVTTEIPFADIKGDFRVMQAVCDGTRPEIPEDCPQELKDLMQWCWVADHNQRPTMESVCRALQSCQTDDPGFSPADVDLPVKSSMGPPSSSAGSGTQESMELGTSGSGDVHMMTWSPHASREQTDCQQTDLPESPYDTDGSIYMFNTPMNITGHPKFQTAATGFASQSTPPESHSTIQAATHRAGSPFASHSPEGHSTIQAAGYGAGSPFASQSPDGHSTIQAAGYGAGSPFASQSPDGHSTIQATGYGAESPFASQSPDGHISGQSASQSPTIQSLDSSPGHPVQESSVAGSFNLFQYQQPPVSSSHGAVGYSSLVSQEVVPRGSPRRIEDVLSDMFMLDLAKQIGPEWTELGIYLGYTLQITERFKIENHTIQDAILKLLINWRQKQDRRQGTKKVVEALSTALMNCGRGDLAAVVQSQKL